MKMVESSPNEQKTLWEKDKLLVTSNFSFSRGVLKTFVLQTRKNKGLFGKGLNDLIKKKKNAFENTVEKRKQHMQTTS